MYVDNSQIVNLDYFENVKDIALCHICTGLVIEPMQCNQCENCYCKNCIAQWLKKSKSCPFKCTSPEFKEATRIVKNMLSKLQVTCPMRLCQDKVSYDEILNHHCEKVVVQCPTCKSQVLKSQISSGEYDQVRLELSILSQKYEQILVENEMLKKELINKALSQSVVREKQQYFHPKQEVPKSSLIIQEPNPIDVEELIKPISENVVISSNLSASVANNSSVLISSSKSPASVPLNISNVPHGFKYQIFPEGTCKHDNTNKVPIFSCCDKAYPCGVCHNQNENHKRGQIKYCYCNNCYAVNPKPKEVCPSCNTRLYKTKYYREEKNYQNAEEHGGYSYKHKKRGDH